MSEGEELAWVRQGLQALIADANLFIIDRGASSEELNEWARETMKYLQKLVGVGEGEGQ